MPWAARVTFAVCLLAVTAHVDVSSAADAGGAGAKVVPPRPEAPSAEGAGCHTAVPGETCFKHVQWAKTEGIYKHPEWYPGLTASSSDAEFQQVVHKSEYTKCPVPCGAGASLEPTAAPPSRVEQGEHAGSGEPIAEEGEEKKGVKEDANEEAKEEESSEERDGHADLDEHEGRSELAAEEEHQEEEKEKEKGEAASEEEEAAHGGEAAEFEEHSEEGSSAEEFEGAERHGMAEGEAMSEEEHEAEEEGEVEPEATPVDVAISSCLCGGVSLVMMLFYLVNNKDRDIRFYAWSIISSTISIFLSVLLYQGINAFITHYFVQFTSSGAWGIIGVAYSLMIGWMVVLEVVMMFIADIFKLPECILGNRHNMMQSWGRLCAHITGFASIRAGCALHHLHHGVAAGPLSASAVVVVHSAILAGLGALLEAFRHFIARRREVRSRWLEEIIEAENDVSALSLSFLVVQVLRFAISGVLPNHEGLEEPQLRHSFSCSVQLFAAAGGFAALVVAVVTSMSRGRFTEGGVMKRLLSVLQVTAAMACAWSIFFASKWELRRLVDEWDPNAMSARVVLALGVSAGGFGIIFVLDHLEDLDSTGRDVDRAIVSLISAMGILVGFSWEQSFEGAVAVFSALTPMPHLAKFSIAILTAVIVVPAWRSYILKSLVKSEASYLRNVSKQRTKSLSPEAMDLVVEAMNSTKDIELAPEIGHSSSRTMILQAGQNGEHSLVAGVERE